MRARLVATEERLGPRQRFAGQRIARVDPFFEERCRARLGTRAEDARERFAALVAGPQGRKERLHARHDLVIRAKDERLLARDAKRR